MKTFIHRRQWSTLIPLWIVFLSTFAGAAPTIESCRVVPSLFAPGQKVAVLVEGENLSSATATVDFSSLGGGLETLSFVINADGTRAVGTGVELADSLLFSEGGFVPVTVTVGDAEGELFTSSKQVGLTPEPVPPVNLITSLQPARWEPGTQFTAVVSGPTLAAANASVSFADFGGGDLSFPLVFGVGEGMAGAMVPSSLTVTEEAEVSVSFDLTDLAGNVTRTVNSARLFDSVPPLPPTAEDISISPSPLQAGRPVTITVTGQAAESGVALVDFRPISPQVFRLPLQFFNGTASTEFNVPGNLPLNVQGVLEVRVTLFSADGSERGSLAEAVPFSSVPPPPDLLIDFDTPEPSQITAAEEVLATGEIGEDVETLLVNGVAATLQGGEFSVSVPVREGRNDIIAVAQGLGATNTASVTITRDATAPVLNVEVPSDGALVATPQVTVAGFVNDLVTGTVNRTEVTVTVNGLPATVRNRSYEIQNFALAPGENEIVVVATDRAGNQRSANLTVTFQNEALQQRLILASGNNQDGLISSILAEPLTVQAVDRLENPLPNVPVTFSVVRGDGTLIAGGDPETTVVIPTDEEGFASVFGQLGSRVGEGNSRFRVTSPGFVGEVVFCASGLARPGTRVAALTPITQVGETGKRLPQPLQVLVTDEGGNPVAGTEVRFRVEAGGGKLLGQSTITLSSNESGRIAIPFVLGDATGQNVHRVIADLPNGPESESAVFAATGLVPQAPEETSLSGVVLNAGNQAMPGVTAHIEGTDLTAMTDDQGQFTIEGCPVGAVRLFIEGNTTSIPGDWPHLEFDLVTVAGRENSVDRPIYLLRLDSQSEKLVGGDEDVTLSLSNVPGAELTIFAGSVTGPNGESEVNLRWTQVNLERVPMAPPNGSQFMLALTLQPAGVRFDPPARIQIPNMGAPPGQQVEMFSFDHDLGEFVAVGTATVSADGAVQASDPGFGLVKSGWHGCVPPPPPCKPWEGDPPMDTPCVKWEVIPPSDECDYTRYKPNNARITSLDAKADGAASARVFTGEAVSLTAAAESEFCDGVEYMWDPGDGSGTQSGASVSHMYEMKGTYTATVTAQCTGCPSASMSKSVSIEVSEDKMVTVQDSDGRKAVNGLLQVVVPPQGESITGKAEFKDGNVPDGRPVWQTPSGEMTGPEVSYRVFTTAGTINIPRLGPFPVPFADPERGTISCDDGTSTKVEAWLNTKQTVSLKTDSLEDWIQNLEKVKNLLGDDDDANPAFSFLIGSMSFESQWAECPNNNLAFYTWKTAGGFAPLASISGDLEIPIGGPIGKGATWLLKYLDVEVGVFVIWGGAINLTGEVERNNCGEIGGSAKLAGQIMGGLEARAVAEGVAAIRMSGTTGITGEGNIGLTDRGLGLNDAQVKWDGIEAAVTVSVEDDFLGGIFDIEINRSWKLINERVLAGPTSLTIIPFR